MKINSTVMKTGIATVSNQKYKKEGITFDRFFIYVPLNVATDSAFPFKDKEKVKITIQDDNTVKLERITTPENCV